MTKCKHETANGKCGLKGCYAYRYKCFTEELCKCYEPMTRADLIRAMSDEELAWELMTWRLETEARHHGVESNYPNTQKSILEWLKQPAEQGGKQCD